jgi:hypothetical protein
MVEYARERCLTFSRNQRHSSPCSAPLHCSPGPNQKVLDSINRFYGDCVVFFFVAFCCLFVGSEWFLWRRRRNRRIVATATSFLHTRSETPRQLSLFIEPLVTLPAPLSFLLFFVLLFVPSFTVSFLTF